MRKRNKLKIIILVLGIIFAVSTISNYNYSDDGEVNERKTRLDERKIKNSGFNELSGIIALWSGPLDTIPNGWKLCNGSSGTLDTLDRFIYFTDSMEEPGTTGGSTSHNHNYTTVPLHDHGETNFTDCTHTHTYSSGQITFTARFDNQIFVVCAGTGATGDGGDHTHNVETVGLSTCYTSIEENIPPYYELAFIKKETNAPVIPEGLIVMWAGDIEDIPVDWALCNGSNGTPDLRDKFIRGVNTGEDPGSSGGTSSHNHTYTDIPSHSHDIVTPTAHTHEYENYLNGASMGSDLIVGFASLSSTDSTSIPHTHTMDEVGQSTCTTENSSHIPPYSKIAFIMNEKETDELPLGSIVMWGNLTVDIPTDWKQCNGTYGTLDMRNTFMRGVATGEQPGIIGGSDTHNHTYTEVPLHNHTIYEDSAEHNHDCFDLSTLTFIDDGAIPIYYIIPTTKTTSPDSFNHNHDILPNGSATCYTSNESNIPPFIKLKCIQKKISILNPFPNNGSTGISCNPFLHVDVEVYKGGDLTVRFHNASDDSVIDADIVFDGSGTALASWSDLLSSKTYLWYVTVDDGLSTIQSNNWTFTTSGTAQSQPLSQIVIVDDDDDDDDESVSASIIVGSIVVATTGAVVATAISIHVYLMKKRFVKETLMPSKKKQPIKKK